MEKKLNNISRLLDIPYSSHLSYEIRGDFLLIPSSSIRNTLPPKK